MKPARPLTRIARTLLLIIVAGLGILSACQSRFIYFPNPYPPKQITAFLQAGGERLDFTTSQGRQTAWLRLPRDRAAPERVWIVTAGNGSIALDFDDLPDQAKLSRDAFVFFDYPGYGECGGKPHPAAIRESLKTAGPIIVGHCHLPAGSLATRGIVWGHSLGAAAALIAAEEYGIRQAVLLSPFTSTMAMTKVTLGVPLGFLVTHRFDNEARLASLLQRGGHAWIFHGSEDEVIPVTMGRQLATQGAQSVTYQEIPGGYHNSLMQDAAKEVIQAMIAAREGS
jgi:pimeloyl-ACP methyl ester carboxylesterase